MERVEKEKRMKTRIMVGLAAVAIGAAALVATASQAGASQELVLNAHQTNIQFVIGGKSSITPPTAAPGPGDSFVIRDDLLRGTTLVGFDNVICTVTFNNNVLCNAVLALNGIGDIHATALLRGNPDGSTPAVFDATIDGGTFAYRDARGYAHIVDNPNGVDSVDNINLD